MPLLAVSAVGSAGWADVDDLNWCFISSVFMNLCLLCLELHTHKRKVLLHTTEETTTHTVLLLNAGLCLIGFVMLCSIVLDSTAASAPIILILLYHILLFCIVCYYQLMAPLHHHAHFMLALDCLSIVGKCGVSISILAEALAHNAPASH